MRPSTLVTVDSDWPTEAPDGCTRRYLALIVATHDDPQRWGTVHLAHSTPEMATEWDLVLGPGVITPYPLVVMGEAYAQVLDRQVSTLIADVPGDLTRAVRRSLSTDGESVAVLNGQRHPLPLGGRDDPRRRWVEGYFEPLRNLSTPVRRLLLDRAGRDHG